MIKNGFTWDFVRDRPISTRPQNYTPKKIISDLEKTKKITAYKHFAHTVASKSRRDIA
jgi:hypothetical protein